MKFQKLITMVLCFTLLASILAGCGASRRNESAAPTEEPTQSAAPSASKSPEDTTESEENDMGSEQTTAESGKVLVVYYSATGNTKAVGDTIAVTLGADTVEIVPIEPYTDEDLDWTNNDSRVSREHDDPDSRDVALTAATVDNWDSYDTVFIGYPIWWGIAAWPVDTFIEANDFTGKNIIPFCTSSSSGLGESGELLAKMAGTGDWQEGKRFRSSASDADISEWAKSVMQ